MKKSKLFLKLLIVTFLVCVNPGSGLAETDEYGISNFNCVLGGLSSSSRYVNVPTSGSFNQNINGSLEAWVYTTDYNTAATHVICSKGTNGMVNNWNWGIYTDSYGAKSRRMYFNIGVQIFDYVTGQQIPLNTWTHVAVTWTDGPNFVVRFYHDGAFAGSSGPINSAWPINNSSLRIGNWEGISNFFRGMIDELRFWSDQRTENEIRLNRFTGIGDAPNSNSGNSLTASAYYDNLIASWTFNDYGVGTAFDRIGGHNGTYEGGTTPQYSLAGNTIPYNLALYFSPPESDNNRVQIPDNSAFDQTINGAIDMWVRLSTNSAHQYFISKGATGVTTSFLFGVTSEGKLFFYTAGNNAFSTGQVLPTQKWTHVAVTWRDAGASFEVKFYVNGSQDGINRSIPDLFPVNADPVRIGGSQAWAGYNIINGYLDEVRFWNRDLSLDEIRKFMFTSGRSSSIPSSTLVGCWNFDGSLVNYGYAAGIDGTFNIGAVNYCRFSGYIGEATTTGFPSILEPHSTVLNRTGSPNPFPGGFTISVPFAPIPDNNPAGITNTITFYNPSLPVTSAEIFLSIDHPAVDNLDITLQAPNGQTRDLSSDNGGSRDNILTIMGDGFFTLPVSDNSFYPPWSNLSRPEQTMGSFGGSNIVGSWTLKVVDDAAGSSGVLQAWGIRFTNVPLGVEPAGNIIPERFSLYQNYPNPFNPVTNIKFDLPVDANVKITIYDVLGKETGVIVNEFKKAGSYKVDFNASSLSSGTYFFRIEAGTFADTKKMMLIK